MTISTVLGLEINTEQSGWWEFSESFRRFSDNFEVKMYSTKLSWNHGLGPHFLGGSEPWLRKLSEPWLKTPKNINFESCLKTHKNMSEPWLKPPKNITFEPIEYPDLAKQVLDKLALVSLLKSQNVWVMAQGIEKWEVKPWLKFNNWWVLSHGSEPTFYVCGLHHG